MGATPGEEEVAVQSKDLISFPRFELDVEVEGALEPGTPIVIRASGRANLETSNAEFRIMAPEREAAARSGWGDDFAIPIREPLPALRREVLSVLEGQTVSVTETVTFPVEGYYQIVVSMVDRTGDFSLRGGVAVQGDVHRTVWLVVREGGGKATDRFRLEELPEASIPRPGPFVVKGAGRAATAPAFRGTVSVDPDGDMVLASSPPSPGQNDVFHFVYYFADDLQQYEPVAGAWWKIEFCTKGQGFTCDQVTGSIDGYTDTDWGGIYFECTQDDGYHGFVYSSDGGVSVGSGIAIQFSGDLPLECGTAHDVYMEKTRARVFENMRITRANSPSLLGVSRPPLDVTLSTSDTDSSSFYQTSTDKVTIWTGGQLGGHVWGEWGVFIAAHEYGHAVHHESMGGLLHYQSCPKPHFLKGAHNLGCATSEGFANYHGVAVRDDVEVYIIRDRIASHWYYPGCNYVDGECDSVNEDGSIIEGAVASFFWDLGEEFSGEYVAEVISTCEVKYLIPGWIRANGVDHLTFCFEQQIDSSVTGSSTYFPTRSSHPSDFRDDADQPSGWSAGLIRDLWTLALYGES